MYNAKQALDVKQSNTLSFVVSYTDDDGKALDLTGFEITAEIKDSSGKSIAIMQSAILNASAGVFELTLPAGTDLPLKILYMDIRFSQNGIVRNSDIIQLNVKQVVTNG